MIKFIFLFHLVLITLNVNCQEEYNVINDLFLKLVGTDSYYETYNTFCIRTNQTNADFEDYLRNRGVDKEIKLYVLVNDSFTPVEDDILISVMKKLNKLDYYMNLFIEAKDTLKKDKHLNINNITETGRYEIKHFEGKEILLKKSERAELLFITISPIVFSKNEGCFYFQLVKGNGDSGYSSFFFIKKSKGLWIIDKEIGLGIS